MTLPRRWFRLVHTVLMTTIMVFWMTLVITLVNAGLGEAFLRQWARAFAVAYVVALPLTYFVNPLVRALAEKIVTREPRDLSDPHR